MDIYFYFLWLMIVLNFMLWWAFFDMRKEFIAYKRKYTEALIFIEAVGNVISSINEGDSRSADLSLKFLKEFSFYDPK